MAILPLVNYYVDESGDCALFNKKGSAIKGSSKTFMLGLLKIKGNNNFTENFRLFKEQILADTIFQTIPSFKKTCLQFHAKNDHIAIKREVFNYIAKLDCSVQVVIRRKSALIEQARVQFEYTKNKVTDKQLYGYLVTRLFKRNIHKADHYNIYFSKRGKTFTNHSLNIALSSTREKFIVDNNISSNSNIKIFCSQPSDHPELQIIDYCLWALQRLYEQKEDAYFNIIKDKFKLIIDIDDKRKSGAGTHYCLRNRISLENINEVS